MEPMLYVIGVLALAIGLLVSVALHELGHLLPAKAFGITVRQYMIGVGPTLVSRYYRDTEYGIKAFPFGGFILMKGMLPPLRSGAAARDASTGVLSEIAPDVDRLGEPVDDPKHSYYSAAVWKRVVIMLGGPAANLLVATVLYTIVLCGLGVSQAIPVVSSVGSCVSTASNAPCRPTDAPSPGALAGFEPGDRITAVDGVPVSDWQTVAATIGESAGIPLRFTVERSGRLESLVATPALSRIGSDTVGFIGITPTVAMVPAPLASVPGAIGDNIARIASLLVTLPEHLRGIAESVLGSSDRDPDGLMSVIGVGRLAGEISAADAASGEQRLAALISLLASLNVALCVFNLLPLLPLDGGRIASALFEGGRRVAARVFHRPDPGFFDFSRLLPVTFVVMVFIGGLSAFLGAADIVAPVTLS